MKERFVVYIKRSIKGSIGTPEYWLGAEFKQYPTEDQLKEVWNKYNKNYDCHYMKVEKQYRFE